MGHLSGRVSGGKSQGKRSKNGGGAQGITLAVEAAEKWSEDQKLALERLE